MSIVLSKRLMAMAEAFKNIKTMADIGTDHGYLPVYLAEKNKLSKAIACDVNIKPLAKAKKIIEAYGLEKIIETRLGSGLSVLKPQEVEVIVMAGMGGLLIRDLLHQEMDIAKNSTFLMLQPMNNQSVLRKYLEVNGFEIIKEDLVLEGRRIYEIISIRSGEMKIEDALEYELGYHYKKNKHPLLKTFLEEKISKATRILKNTQGEQTQTAKKKHEEKLNYIQILEEVKKCL